MTFVERDQITDLSKKEVTRTVTPVVVNTLEYKESTPEHTKLCIEFRDMCLKMQSWIKDNTDSSRVQSVALTELETLNMWTNKAIIFSNIK